MTKETKIQLAVVLSTMAVATVGILVLRRFVGVRGRIVKNTLKEYKNWNYGKMNENSPEAIEHLRKYWKSVGKDNWSEGSMRGTAWSAAFTSYILQKSGVRNFTPSTSHSIYIQDAKENKTGIKAYRPYDTKIEKGDLICYARQGGITYDSKPNYLSHCDFVVDVKKDHAKVIGGNVSDTVKYQDRGVTLESGKISKKTTRPYIAVLKVN